MQIQNFNTKKKIFLIAEIGNNHEGDFKIAKKLIFLAKKMVLMQLNFNTLRLVSYIQKKIKKA